MRKGVTNPGTLVLSLSLSLSLCLSWLAAEDIQSVSWVHVVLLSF